jgi:hypothetical protein
MSGIRTQGYGRIDIVPFSGEKANQFVDLKLDTSQSSALRLEAKP